MLGLPSVHVNWSSLNEQRNGMLSIAKMFIQMTAIATHTRAVHVQTKHSYYQSPGWRNSRTVTLFFPSSLHCFLSSLLSDNSLAGCCHKSLCFFFNLKFLLPHLAPPPSVHLHPPCVRSVRINVHSGYFRIHKFVYMYHVMSSFLSINRVVRTEMNRYASPMK